SIPPHPPSSHFFPFISSFLYIYLIGFQFTALIFAYIVKAVFRRPQNQTGIWGYLMPVWFVRIVLLCVDSGLNRHD
ncbi:hypothetical protein, partial [Neisseria elongata]